MWRKQSLSFTRIKIKNMNRNNSVNKIKNMLFEVKQKSDILKITKYICV
jgi:hypothetical protein